ncbi:YeeE/YedE family protein [Polymorphum gilvum]|uniref:SoxT protein n=1 Tax=Polymorphum gilvum (strain LMG 25793 / CGMCC 1.9160 / SL003B-26A1) TaxID=991905 RepID=F2J554_POLGS|nr:YeeE/YedE family protein [Polymorphum gilvum]ADZ71113.1 SoxT protein [Polymorphum gilvum SL003B-26A1]
METADLTGLVPVLGICAGVVLGFAARTGHFCTLSALERFWYAGDSTGLRTWGLAAASALVAVQLMAMFGLVDLSESFYLSERFSPSGAILGGILFGIGMAFVGTCGFGALVRLGGGSLRALVVLVVLGLSALAAQRGLVAQLRIHIVDNLALDLSFAGDQSIGSLVSALAGMDLRMAVAGAMALALLAWIFSSRTYRRNSGAIVTGVVIGLVIAFGFFATSFLAERSFDPVQIEAGSFVVPVGDTLLQIVTFTGTIPDYGVGLVLGTFLGAVLGAWRRRDMRWEACDDARELGRHLFGATLMGVGGVFAMGCTIGQGVSAFSTMAVSAPIVLVSIAFGARLGLAWLFEGSLRAAFQRNQGSAPTAAE